MRVAVFLLAALGCSVTAAQAEMTALPRIGVRTPQGQPAEFYVRVSGERFIPKGFNHTVLGAWHATFNTDVYRPEAMEAVLTQMADLGANTIRVWIWGAQDEHGYTGAPSSKGLQPAYVENVVDFLRRAAAHGIYVVAVMDETPHNAYYDQIAARADAAAPHPEVAGYNRGYMTAGGIAAKCAAAEDFIRSLKKINPGLLQGVLGWSLSNEVFVLANEGPFSQETGRVEGVGNVEVDSRRSNVAELPPLRSEPASSLANKARLPRARSEQASSLSNESRLSRPVSEGASSRSHSAGQPGLLPEEASGLPDAEKPPRQRAPKRTYDMAVMEDRQACYDDAILYAANAFAKAVKEAEPEALVTAGMWTSDAHGRPPFNGLPHDGKDQRICPRPSVLASAESRLDFLDIHIYPWDGTSTVRPEAHEHNAVAASGKAVLLGETGVFKDKTPEQARGMLREMIEQAYGMGYAGHLMWAWDLTMVPGQTWSAVEEGLGAFAMQLGPETKGP